MKASISCPRRTSRSMQMALEKLFQLRKASEDWAIAHRNLTHRCSWDYTQEIPTSNGRPTSFPKVCGSASNMKATKTDFSSSQHETLKIHFSFPCACVLFEHSTDIDVSHSLLVYYNVLCPELHCRCWDGLAEYRDRYFFCINTRVINIHAQRCFSGSTTTGYNSLITGLWDSDTRFSTLSKISKYHMILIAAVLHSITYPALNVNHKTVWFQLLFDHRHNLLLGSYTTLISTASFHTSQPAWSLRAILDSHNT